MKTILFVVAGIGMLSAPAVAGNGKKKHREAKPVTLAAKVEAPKPAADATTDAAAVIAANASAALDAGALDIPALPPDTSSVLAPYADLERRAVVTVKPAKPRKGKAPVMKMGNDFVLGRRQTGAKFERDVEQIIPRSLSQAQVATVVQAHMSDIQNCWDLVPHAQRAGACTAELELSISDAGVVTDIELGGDVPAGAHQCMTSAITRWAFPVAETKTEIEYGISLRSR
ncbi:MAG TPA: hypothetical protein VIV11_15835 [Kofleriaceae bacterium]